MQILHVYGSWRCWQCSSTSASIASLFGEKREKSPENLKRSIRPNADESSTSCSTAAMRHHGAVKTGQVFRCRNGSTPCRYVCTMAYTSPTAASPIAASQRMSSCRHQQPAESTSNGHLPVFLFHCFTLFRPKTLFNSHSPHQVCWRVTWASGCFSEPGTQASGQCISSRSTESTRRSANVFCTDFLREDHGSMLVRKAPGTEQGHLARAAAEQRAQRRHLMTDQHLLPPRTCNNGMVRCWCSDDKADGYSLSSLHGSHRCVSPVLGF